MEFKRGDQYGIEFTITDQDGAVVDLTGGTVKFTVRSKDTVYDSNNDSAVIFKTVAVHTDPTNGVTEIPMTTADTADVDAGDYLYDIQVTLASGDIISSDAGTFTLVNDITK